ncbi:MAG: DJ-1/PfpI family protein [Spirochaetaceae bacterium]
MASRPAIILYDQCSLSEIMDFLSLFQNTNPTLIVAGAHDATIRTVEGLTLAVDAAIPDADTAEYNPVVITGGDVAAAVHDERLRSFLRAAHDETEAVVGGICNGVWLMAAAGLLDGKRCTHTGHPSCGAPDEVIATAKPLFENAHYIPENLVVDGRLVTAKPWASGEFTVQVAWLSGLISEDEVESTRRYLRGDFEP